MEIHFTNITDTLIEYRDTIDTFVSSLEGDKAFITLTTKMIMGFDLVVVATDNDEIIGITGLKRAYHGLLKSYIAIKKEYRGKGLGKQITLKQLAEARKRYYIFMAEIHERNIASLKMYLSVGSIIIGKRGSRYYLLTPLNHKGRFLSYLIKMLFPIFNIMDNFRR